MASTKFVDVGLSVFDVGASLFVAGATFSDVGVSLFVAGAAFGEIWVDGRSATGCIFPHKMRLQSAKRNLCERAGARCPVHARIHGASPVFSKFSSYFGTSFLVAGAVFVDVGG